MRQCLDSSGIWRSHMCQVVPREGPITRTGASSGPSKRYWSRSGLSPCAACGPGPGCCPRGACACGATSPGCVVCCGEAAGPGSGDRGADSGHTPCGGAEGWVYCGPGAGGAYGGAVCEDGASVCGGWAAVVGPVACAYGCPGTVRKAAGGCRTTSPSTGSMGADCGGLAGCGVVSLSSLTRSRVMTPAAPAPPGVAGSGSGRHRPRCA